MKREAMELQELYRRASDDLARKLSNQLDLDNQELERLIEGCAYWVCMEVSEGRLYDRVLEEYVTRAYERAKGWAERRQREFRLLRDALRGVEGLVLDVGAGYGRTVALYQELGLDVVCTELFSLGPLLLARKGCEAVLRCDGRELPFRDGAFDTVVMTWVLHEVEGVQGRWKAVRESHRVLGAGGRLLVVDPVWKRGYTDDALLRLLGEAGFKPLRAEWFGEESSASDNQRERYLFIVCGK